MSTYTLTVGLEVHAELATKTKMFCKSKNDPNAKNPNTNVCPVCMAHPGTLPVINREAVHQVLRVGAALGGALADYTEFDRKNYFYPDIPKGYQISQYEYPLVSGGSLCGVDITRVHLEEDTASSMHDDVRGVTLIDFNRAGVPLMELVTEPVMHSPEEVGAFARELQLLLRYLGVSDANMEKGEMRVEANISVSNGDALGTKVEVKNLNSFKAMERAIAFEEKRHIALLESGKTVIQETRGWDDARQETFVQRVKEGSADYRYFPDPDLPKLKIADIKDFSLETLQESLPELPSQRRARYIAMGVKEEDAAMYTRYRSVGSFFDGVAEVLGQEKEHIILASNYISNDLVPHIRDIESRDSEIKGKIEISAKNFAALVEMIVSGEVSSRGAKDTLLLMLADTQKDPRSLAENAGLMQSSNEDEIKAMVEEIINENPEVVADYRGGKEASLQFLVGQGMKKSKGSANPKMLQSIFKDLL